MTNVLLKDWNRAGRSWILDISSGSARVSGNGVYHGFLAALSRRDGDAMVALVAAVYADSGKLWFQVDGRRWEVEDVDFESKADVSGMSRFTILSHGRAVADIVYPDPVNRSDLSFDELDLELQDIFYFMSKNGGDPVWRAGVLSLWGKGTVDD